MVARASSQDTRLTASLGEARAKGMARFDLGALAAEILRQANTNLSGIK